VVRVCCAAGPTAPQVRNICQAANAARQHQGQQRGRAATLLSSLPAEISSSSVLDALARGVEGQHRGGISIQRLGEWASMSTFHQVGRPRRRLCGLQAAVCCCSWLFGWTWPPGLSHNLGMPVPVLAPDTTCVTRAFLPAGALAPDRWLMQSGCAL
jgi:hypothetical protein